MKIAEQITEEINQIFIGVAEWETGLDIEEKITELLTWKEDICKKQKDLCADNVIENCSAYPTFGEIEDKILTAPEPE